MTSFFLGGGILVKYNQVLSSGCDWMLSARPPIFNFSIPLPKPFGDRSTCTNYKWYHRQLQVSSLFFFLVLLLFLASLLHQRQLMVFHWSLRDSKSPLVFRTFLSILADLSNTIVWKVSACPPISNSSSPLKTHLGDRFERANYTRMLRAILNKSWQQHPTRHQLYGHLPPITKTIQVRRTRHAGHCWRSRDELIRDVLLWIPTHGRAKAGRPARTYIQQLCEDTGCCPEDLPRAMNDREEWRERVRDIRATSAI